MASYQQERNEELYKRVYLAMLLPHIRNLNDAILYAVNHECSRFYVSYEDAWRYVYAKERGKETKRVIKKIKYIMDIIYDKYIKQRTIETSTKPIDTFTAVFFSPAPCFFLSFNQAKRIVGKMRSERRAQKKAGYVVRQKNII